ncbi:hypothetical protein HDK64DRAFT_80883 [Phyllosticta capitalensis]
MCLAQSTCTTDRRAHGWTRWMGGCCCLCLSASCLLACEPTKSISQSLTWSATWPVHQSCMDATPCNPNTQVRSAANQKPRCSVVVLLVIHTWGLEEIRFVRSARGDAMDDGDGGDDDDGVGDELADCMLARPREFVSALRAAATRRRLSHGEEEEVRTRFE